MLKKATQLLTTASKTGLTRTWLRCVATSEPERPQVVTEIPGPKSRELLTQLDNIQHVHSIQFFVDYERSYGNYMVDADGNTILDLFSQIASAPLGYNHPALVDALKNPDNIAHFINRPALGCLPPTDWPERLDKALLKVAPKGLKNVQTMACGACGNEHAFKAVFMAYRRRQRGGAAPSAEELESSVYNAAPGCPQLSILSFTGGFHGRTMAALACSHTKWHHKLDFPSLDWPFADFPTCRYPLEKHAEENAREEDRCLQQVRDKIAEYRERSPVAGLVIEPIQGEGGDNFASPQFFQKIQEICKENGVYLIMDEVQTGGGATGQWWYSETFGLPTPPDALVFSKKMLTAGFYCTDELRPQEPYRIFNTWMGDTAKVVLLEVQTRIIEEQGLLQLTKQMGEVLVQGMTKLAEEFPAVLNSARGAGAYCAVDVCTPEHRDKLVDALRAKGIHAGGNGINTLRLRPAMIFQRQHADIFLQALRECVVENQ